MGRPPADSIWSTWSQEARSRMSTRRASAATWWPGRQYRHLVGLDAVLEHRGRFLLPDGELPGAARPGTTVTADNNASLGTLTDNAVRSASTSWCGANTGGRAPFVRRLGDPRCDGNLGHQHRIGPPAEHRGMGNPGRSTTGSLALDVQTINNWPMADFDFTGNGSGTANPANFLSIRIHRASRGQHGGRSLWISGYTTPFGAAPPDFDAVAVNNEASVQSPEAKSAAPHRRPREDACGIGSQSAIRRSWKCHGTRPRPVHEFIECRILVGLTARRRTYGSGRK